MWVDTKTYTLYFISKINIIFKNRYEDKSKHMAEVDIFLVLSILIDAKPFYLLLFFLTFTSLPTPKLKLKPKPVSNLPDLAMSWVSSDGSFRK